VMHKLTSIIQATRLTLGWEFHFRSPISGTPNGSKILIPCLITEIPVGMFFELRSRKSRNRNSNLQNSEFW
jgi:hypothetical protein